MPARNLAILLTPSSPAAIAVVRLCGEGVAPFLAHRFSRPASEGRCVHGNLTDESGNVLDDAVVVLSRGGTVADINLHGGPWVVQAVLDLARRAGFEVCRANDAPEVAYDAATALQREVLEHIPLARTELGLRTLLAQPQAWADALKHGKLGRDELERILADRVLQHLLHPPRVAIVGAPNVGKSTLANQLFATERSITADLPGTTRDWVGEIANVDGLPVLLVDTPGVRDTADPIEREAIARSGRQVAGAELVLLVLDATRPLESEQSRLVHRFGHESRSLIVLNKSDLAGAPPIGPDLPRIDVATAAVTGAGVAELRSAILAHFGCAGLAPDRPRVWTARQGDIVRRAMTRPAILGEMVGERA
jgi:tRNA modification GTPase